MTLQELQQKGQVKTLTINDLKSKGEVKVVNQSPPAPTLGQSIGNVLTKRAENLGTIADISGKGREQSLASGVLQTAGEAGGALADISFEIAKRLTPNIVKEKIKSGIKSVAETNKAQQAISSITSWSEQHPEAAKNLVATLNLVSADLPIAKGLAGGTKLVSKGLGKASTILGKSALKKSTKESENFLRNLIRPEQTKLVKEAQVGRTIEKGKGIFKTSEILPTKEQLNIESALKEVPISSKNTFQQNYNIIRDTNTNLAKDLEKKVSESGFIIPKKETISKLEKASIKLSESPLITGDAEVMANRLLEGAKKFVNENPGTGSGLLKARKDFDNWVLNQKPKAFDASAENAFTIANREVRNTINDLLEAKAPNIGVKKALNTQHNLYKALDVIAPKAAKEADSAIGRSLQKIGQVLGVKNKAVQATAAVAGIGGLGAAATFAPIVAGVGIPSYLVYKAGKFVMKPETQRAISKLLGESEKALKTISDPIKIKALEEANSKLKLYLKNIKPGLTIEDVSLKGKGEILKSTKDTTNPLNFKTAEDYVKAQTPSKDYITVYHRTDVPIENFGKTPTYSKENAGEFFVSNKKNGQAEGYGKNILELRVKKSDLTINDEFPNGENHYTLPTSKVDNYLKTKSQLISEWNKAQGKTPLKSNPLMAEAKIDERLLPLTDKDGIITVYRASSKFPKNVLLKDTFVATKPSNANYYAQSWYKGDPSNIKLKSFRIPASNLKRGGSNDAWQLISDYTYRQTSNNKKLK